MLNGLRKLFQVIQSAFILIEVNVINPAISFIESIKFIDATLKNLWFKEIFNDYMRIRTGGLVLTADVGKLAGPFSIIKKPEICLQGKDGFEAANIRESRTF